MSIVTARHVVIYPSADDANVVLT